MPYILNPPGSPPPEPPPIPVAPDIPNPDIPDPDRDPETMDVNIRDITMVTVGDGWDLMVDLDDAKNMIERVVIVPSKQEMQQEMPSNLHWALFPLEVETIAIYFSVESDKRIRLKATDMSQLWQQVIEKATKEGVVKTTFATLTTDVQEDGEDFEIEVCIKVGEFLYEMQRLERSVFHDGAPGILDDEPEVILEPQAGHDIWR